MLHYRKYEHDASSPWVIFIHGAGASSAIWYKQIKDIKQHYNILLIDLRGHGKSKKGTWQKNDTFLHVAEDVLSVLDHLHIRSAHFIGISLGTIVIQTLAQNYPDRVSSMILGGAIIKLDLRTKFLLSLGNASRFILPYMSLYKLFAWIIMPKNSHIESRHAFVEQAKKMCQKEFMRWFSLTKKINPFLRKLQLDVVNIPTLFLMGEEDYLFLTSVQELVKKQQGLQLIKIKDAGHVCNIDQPEVFNQHVVEFIDRFSKEKVV